MISHPSITNPLSRKDSLYVPVVIAYYLYWLVWFLVIHTYIK